MAKIFDISSITNLFGVMNERAEQGALFCVETIFTRAVNAIENKHLVNFSRGEQKVAGLPPLMLSDASVAFISRGEQTVGSAELMPQIKFLYTLVNAADVDITELHTELDKVKNVDSETLPPLLQCAVRHKVLLVQYSVQIIQVVHGFINTKSFDAFETSCMQSL